MTLLISLSSFAQGVSVATTNSSPRTVIHDGFGFRIAKQFMTMQSDASYLTKDDLNLDQSFGLALVYSRLLDGEIGCASNLHLMKLKNSNVDYTISRFDVNLTFGLPDIVFFKVGANLSHIFTAESNHNGKADETGKNFQPGLGMQAGFGFQFYKNFSADIGYVQMRQTAELFGENKNYDESGAEISITQNF